MSLSELETATSGEEQSGGEQSGGEQDKKFVNLPPLKYGKKFYLGEFLAERFIQITAFISIAVILGIFYYVFQEASFAFFQPEQKTEQKQAQVQTSASDSKSDGEIAQTNSESESGDLKPESYGSEDLKPETYGASEDLKPETYSPDNSESKPKSKKSEELKPETYGASSDLKPETYSSDNSEATKNTGDAKEETNNGVAEATPAQTPAAPALENPSEESHRVQTVNYTRLISANDTIDGKASYIWQPVGDAPKYNLIPLFIGSLKVTLIGILLAAPFAILAAIFTNAFAPRWVKEILKPAIEILAGFPSVVLGFFCLITLASVVQTVFHTTFRLNSFVGGIGMALAVIPIIYTVTEDALAAVPKHLKEASLALGASRWQTAYRVILPAATPGVFAALILGFGRAFGETMIALMATGNASLVSADIFESVRTMSATIGAEMAEVEFHGVHYGILFLIGALLFLVTFSLNAIAEFYIRKKLLKKFQGN